MEAETQNQEPEVQDEQTQAADEQPKPGMVSMTQEALSALIAKEVAKGKRAGAREAEQKARMNQQPKEQAAGTEEDSPVMRELAAMKEVVQGLLSTQAAANKDAAFTAAVAGLDIDQDTSEELRILHEHSPEVFAKRIERIKSADQPPPKKGPGFAGVGAPNPVSTEDRATDPRTWDKDTVARLRASGQFLPKVEEWRRSLPGGSGGLFPARIPKPGK